MGPRKRTRGVILRILSDDVGSLPLPTGLDIKTYTMAYFRAIELIGQGTTLLNDPLLNHTFIKICREVMRNKLKTGLDVVNYPQMGVDMITQFLRAIQEHSKESNRPYLVDERYAIIPQLVSIDLELKAFSETHEELPKLKVCITGPIELYLHTEVGNFVSEAILMNLAESVQKFIRNAFASVETEIGVVSIDEPSLGLRDLGRWDDNILIHALEKAVAHTKGATTQIHLHSLNSRQIPFQVEGIDVLTCEYASNPKHLDGVSKKEFDLYDKTLRVGVARTDIDALNLELHEKGIEGGFNRIQAGELSASVIVESQSLMVKRLKKAYNQFGDRISFSGPDCGFKNWPTQEAALLQLSRAVNAIKEFHNELNQ
jgi:5-methyltetrahydropteroyltriglutamate--homocysteine methyltransferase